MRTLGIAAAIATMSAGLLAVTAPTAGAKETYWMPASGNLTIHGRGFGHGRGLSQYGAQGAALAGRTSQQILDFYYPSTASSRQAGSIRVRLTGDTTSGVQVKATTGLRVRDLGDNAAWPLSQSPVITQWAIEPYGDHQTRLFYYHSTQQQWIAWGGRSPLKGMAQFEGPAVIPLVLPNGTTRRYRGALRSADRTGATLDTVNVLPLDLYVRGVVPRESISTWRPAALQAQAVAARTYSVFHRIRSTARDYDLCDTAACQVYGGYDDEVTSTSDAVTATAGLIRTYGGKPIIAEFTSSNGGQIAPGPVPYQVAKPDPYDGRPGNGNPNHTWTKSVDRASAEAAFGVGTLKRIVVTNRDGHGVWGGRVTRVEVVGSAGTKAYSGGAVKSKLKLRETYFAPAQSEIIRRWAAIGGNNSPVGSIAGDEYLVRGGSAHNFSTGRIYRSTRGSWEVFGPILTRYSAIGGPNHRIGLPISPRVASGPAGTLVQAYGAGRFVHTAATGAREVSGPIYLAYYRTSMERGQLGVPTSYEFDVPEGRRQMFRGGHINWYAATNTTGIVYNGRP